jgi:tetratricopeptide (TPR) repeat protein
MAKVLYQGGSPYNVRVRNGAVRPILSGALLFALLAARPVHALPAEKIPWIELHTPSFVLFSDAGEKNARAVAARLERLRSVLGQLNPGLKLTTPNPTYVFVFRDTASLKPYRRIYNGQPVGVGGYFLTETEANWVAINGDPRGNETAIIQHELLHSILSNNYPSLPLWFNEGMAEVYSSFIASDREAKIGAPVPEHVIWLRRHGAMPLADLFAVRQASPDYNEGVRRGAFYANAWALVHDLLVGNPALHDRAPAYFQEMAREHPAPDAFHRAFGLDDAALERELNSYVRKRIYVIQTLPVQPDEELHITKRDVPRAEALARLGNLLASLDPTLRPAADEHFRTALALDPEQPQALAGMGRLETLAGSAQQARPWLEKAARKAPDDFLIQYLYGAALLDATPGPQEIRQAKEAFARAVALQPEFGEAWARLAYAQAQDDALLPEAVRSFETAHRLLPTRLDIAYNLLLAAARSGRMDRAQEVLDRVIAVRGTPDDLLRAQTALLQEKRRGIEDLIGQGDLPQAAARLEELIAQAPTPDQKTALQSRLDEVRGAIDYNRFVDRYNEAMRLAGSDPKAAIAILEDLVATTKEPGQVAQAKRALESLRTP